MKRAGADILWNQGDSCLGMAQRGWSQLPGGRWLSWLLLNRRTRCPFMTVQSLHPCLSSVGGCAPVLPWLALFVPFFLRVWSASCQANHASLTARAPAATGRPRSLVFLNTIREVATAHLLLPNTRQDEKRHWCWNLVKLHLQLFFMHQKTHGLSFLPGAWSALQMLRRPP